MSYGAIRAMYRRACRRLSTKFLDKPPGSDLPVEQPTKFTLAINLKTARGARPRRTADAARHR